MFVDTLKKFGATHVTDSVMKQSKFNNNFQIRHFLFMLSQNKCLVFGEIPLEIAQIFHDVDRDHILPNGKDVHPATTAVWLTDDKKILCHESVLDELSVYQANVIKSETNLYIIEDQYDYGSYGKPYVTNFEILSDEALETFLITIRDTGLLV